jgi:hypothetical protein
LVVDTLLGIVVVLLAVAKADAPKRPPIITVIGETVRCLLIAPPPGGLRRLR